MPRLLKLGGDYINLDRIYQITPHPDAGMLTISYMSGREQDTEARLPVPVGEEEATAERIAKAVDPNYLVVSGTKVDG